MGKGKLKFLEGLRGIMAINVMLDHFAMVYYPQMYFQDYAASIGGFLSLFATTPLSILMNGNIAVQYFFALTGFLVGRSFFYGKGLQRREILVKTCNRYLRLLPVVFAATLFTYLTMVLGLQHHMKILDQVANPDMLLVQCNFEPTFKRFLMNAVYEPFVLYGSDFLRQFWMLRYEVWGYVLCMLTCYFLQDSRLRRVGYVAIALLLWILVDENYMGFFMGLFVADLCYCREKNTTVFSRFYHRIVYHKATLALMAAAGLYLAACPMFFTGWYGFFGAIPKMTTELVRATGTALLLFCLVEVPKAARLFEGKVLLFLGEISFCIYAFHWPIALTLQSWLFDLLNNHMGYDGAAVLAFAITFPITIAASYGAYLVLEKNKKLDIRAFLEKMTLT